MENEKVVLLLIMVSMIGFINMDSVEAVPIIENITIQPEIIWMGNNVAITLDCYDDEGYSIQNVKSVIEGPDIFLPEMDFVYLGGNQYSLDIDEFYFSKNGLYTGQVYCINENNVNSSDGISFSVSILDGYVSDSPGNVFLGEEIEIGFFVFKDGTAIKKNVDFEVRADGDILNHKLLYFDTNKGWILKVDSPNSGGEYLFEVTASYDGASITNSTEINVQDVVEFKVVSIDKTLITNNDEIVLTLEAKDKGNIIDIQSNMLVIKINSIDATITDITQVGDYFDVTIDPPEIVPGNYEMVVGLNYNSHHPIKKIDITYAIEISGEIVNDDNKGIKLEIKFISNESGAISSFNTDSNGIYSGKLGPGNYDIEVIHGKSVLKLFDVDIDEYDDPLRFYPVSDITIPGLVIAGFYNIEVSLPYSDATLKLNYDDNGISDETELVIFKCDNWNVGKSLCNVDWDKVDPSIDIVKNTVEIDVDNLAAFAVGNENTLYIDAALDKESYNFNENVKITGLVKDQYNNPVSNANVQISSGTISDSVVSGSDGIFTFNFVPEQKEGEFIVKMDVSMSPYVPGSLEKAFSLEKSVGMYLLVPDAVRLAQGESRSFDFTITNTGQAELNGIKVEITGIPEEFYEIMVPIIDELSASQEQKIEIVFNVPENSTLKTYSGRFNVTGDSVHSQAIFAFTILEAVKEVQPSNDFIMPEFKLPSFSLPTANIIANDIAPTIGYVVVIGLIMFSCVFLIKKKKIKQDERVEITNVLNDIKREINRGNQEEERDVKKW